MKSRFFADAIAKPWVILGRKLRPYSHAHEIFLTSFGSTFIVGGPDTLDDLGLSVYICGLTAEECEAAFAHPWALRVDMWLWWKIVKAKRILARVFTPSRWFNPEYIDFRQKARQFREYVEAGRHLPRFNCRDSGHSAEIPMPQAIKVSLMKHFGWSESFVLNRPYKANLWDYLTLASMNPDSGLVLIAEDEPSDLPEGMVPCRF